VPGRVLALQAGALAMLAGERVAGPLPGVATPLAPLVRASVAVWAVVGLGAAVLAVLVGRRPAADDTWGCAYAEPTPRMQYGGGSFAEILTTRLLPASLRARETITPARSLFPAPGRYAADATDPLTRRVYEPFFTRWGDRFAGLRWLQQGLLHVYLLYILLVVLGALAWTSLRDWIGA
jgi:hydrogenase-4 component B